MMLRELKDLVEQFNMLGNYAEAEKGDAVSTVDAITREAVANTWYLAAERLRAVLDKETVVLNSDYPR